VVEICGFLKRSLNGSRSGFFALDNMVPQFTADYI
jgi:hypothetical protein